MKRALRVLSVGLFGWLAAQALVAATLGAAMWLGGGQQADLITTRRGWAVIGLVAVKSFGRWVAAGVAAHRLLWVAARPRRLGAAGARLGGAAGAALGFGLAATVRPFAWQVAALLVPTFALWGGVVGWLLRPQRRR